MSEADPNERRCACGHAYRHHVGYRPQEPHEPHGCVLCKCEMFRPKRRDLDAAVQSLKQQKQEAETELQKSDAAVETAEKTLKEARGKELAKRQWLDVSERLFNSTIPFRVSPKDLHDEAEREVVAAEVELEETKKLRHEAWTRCCHLTCDLAALEKTQQILERSEILHP